MAEAMGWPGFFLFTVAAGIPGLLLLAWLIRLYPPAPRTVAA